MILYYLLILLITLGSFVCISFPFMNRRRDAKLKGREKILEEQVSIYNSSVKEQKGYDIDSTFRERLFNINSRRLLSSYRLQRRSNKGVRVDRFLILLLIVVIFIIPILFYQRLGFPNYDLLDKSENNLEQNSFENDLSEKRYKDSDLELFIQSKNQNASEWLLLADYFMDLGNYKEGLKTLIYANRIIKNNVDLILVLASYYQKLLPEDSIYEYVKPLYVKALGLDDKNSAIYILLARLEERYGSINDAISYYNLARGLLSGMPKVRDMIDKRIKMMKNLGNFQ